MSNRDFGVRNKYRTVFVGVMVAIFIFGGAIAYYRGDDALAENRSFITGVMGPEAYKTRRYKWYPEQYRYQPVEDGESSGVSWDVFRPGWDNIIEAVIKLKPGVELSAGMSNDVLSYVDSEGGWAQLGVRFNPFREKVRQPTVAPEKSYIPFAPPKRFPVDTVVIDNEKYGISGGALLEGGYGGTYSLREPDINCIVDEYDGSSAYRRIVYGPSYGTDESQRAIKDEGLYGVYVTWPAVYKGDVTGIYGEDLNDELTLRVVEEYGAASSGKVLLGKSFRQESMQHPEGPVWEDVPWQYMGVVQFTRHTNVLTFSLTSYGCSSRWSADAIALVPLSSWPEPEPSYVADNALYPFVAEGRGWETVSDSQAYNGSYLIHQPNLQSEEDKAVWTFGEIIQGGYEFEVYATWKPAGNLSDNVEVRISGSSGAERIDQTKAPEGIVWGGAQWQKVGVIRNKLDLQNAKTVDPRVEFGCGVGGNSCRFVADAVLLVSRPALNWSPSARTSFQQTVFNTDEDAYEFITSVNSIDIRDRDNYTTSTAAVWKWVGVPAGRYNLYATWEQRQDASMVYDTTVGERFTVDQSRQIVAGSEWGGHKWENLGEIEISQDNNNFEVIGFKRYMYGSSGSKSDFVSGLRLVPEDGDFSTEDPGAFQCSPRAQIAKVGDRITVRVPEGYRDVSWVANPEIRNESSNPNVEFSGVVEQGEYLITATTYRGSSSCRVEVFDELPTDEYELIDSHDNRGHFRVVSNTGSITLETDPTGLHGFQKLYHSLLTGNVYKKGVRAEWRWMNISPGDYVLYATWAMPSMSYQVSRMTTVTYDKWEVDQRQKPNGPLWRGRPWQELGTVRIEEGESMYVLSSNEFPTSGNSVIVSLDAMRLVSVGKDFNDDDSGGYRLMNPVISDYNWEDPYGHGIWSRPSNGVVLPTTGAGHNNSYLRCSGFYCDEVQWQFKKVPEGKYDVYATWVPPVPAETASELKIKFIIGEDGEEVIVNANAYPAGPTYNEVVWQKLDSVQFSGDLNVGVNVLDSLAYLDAVMLVPEGFEFAGVGGSEINLDMGSEAVEIDAVDVGASTGVNLLDTSSDNDASVGTGFWVRILRTMVWWK